MKKVIGVGVLLQTPRGTYLFQERDFNTNLHPGQIAPFGGGIENDEDVFQCAIRELSEELNLTLNVNDLETVGIFEGRNAPDVYIQMFLAKDIHPSALTIREGKSVVELSKDQALQHSKVTDFTKEVLNSIA